MVMGQKEWLKDIEIMHFVACFVEVLAAAENPTHEEEKEQMKRFGVACNCHNHDYLLI